ncbi:hypothetical protein GCM10023322_54220 [Rugosimonospora acidiphila]|uniref:Uncharacterized protein n=1 Tax=Rugosimonospora acidiphila TaxID=556531 RepID=A0ABP9SBI0_9ACTN
MPGTDPAAERIRVRYEGSDYSAEPVAKGAAFEIFSVTPVDGFLPNPRPGARKLYRRFVPAAEIYVIEGRPPVPQEQPLSAPVSRGLSWSSVHQLSQSSHADDGGLLVARIRLSAKVSRGTRMVKVLSGRQLAGQLHGWLPQGFCYREYDTAHLRTPAELSVLRSDGDDGRADPAVFALRWRAVDSLDYQVPFAGDYAGLTRMPPADRLGSPVLGTGFTPSGQHVIPEFVTANLADLPLTAFAELVAYTEDGTEVVLYRYLPEQRAWGRMFGPQWRWLFAAVPGIAPEQEYFMIPPAPTKLMGRHRGQDYEAIADPPGEFRVLAKTRAARYAVETLYRRTPYVTWRRVPCTVVRDEGEWLRVRLIRPDAESVTQLGASCIERGIYETWAPRAETAGYRDVDTEYDLGPAVAPVS